LSTTALDSDSVVVSSSNNALNVALCNTLDVTSNASTSSIVIVEEHIYSDTEKGIELVEWHYPPLVNQDSVTDATLNEALCTSSYERNSVNWIGESMDSQILFDQLKSLGSCPGPIHQQPSKFTSDSFFGCAENRLRIFPHQRGLGYPKNFRLFCLTIRG
jgi:hypothetical protein